jgi:hypothetical protein
MEIVNMDEVLLRALIAANHLKVATEVDATVKAKSLDNQSHRFNETFTVTRLLESRKTGRLVLEMSSLRDGSMARVDAVEVTGIDGMTPERFAENYMIAPDGTPIKIVGKRRGRRPKGWNEETQSVDLG